MHVPHDLDGRTELDEGGLTEEDLARGEAEEGDLGLLETYGFGKLATVPDLEEAGDHVVDVQRALLR